MNAIEALKTSTLAATNLTVTRGGRTILPSLDVSFDSGQITAVLGPNGAGKSTLLAALAGLLEASEGAVHLDNTALADIAPRLRARRIGFLPQNPEIAWPVDVLTLVGLGRIPHRPQSKQADDAIAVARALQITSTTEWAQRDVTTLSGGERARVLFARVLAGEPEWILADEPFAGLDPAHQFEMAELLQSLAAEGRGIVCTLHDLTLAARVADRVIVMCDGRIVADGPPRTALSPETLLSAYGIEAHWITENQGAAAPLIAIVGRRR
jgi:iron complex transport system ATP-binding protein